MLKVACEQVDVKTCKKLSNNTKDVESWKPKVEYKIHLNKLIEKLIETCKNSRMKNSTTMVQSLPPTQWIKRCIFHTLNPKPWICIVKI